MPSHLEIQEGKYCFYKILQVITYIA